MSHLLIIFLFDNKYKKSKKTMAYNAILMYSKSLAVKEKDSLCSIGYNFEEHCVRKSYRLKSGR